MALIEKSTNGEDADNAPGPSILVGSPVTWRYVVTNTGTTSLTNVLVTNDRGVSVTCVSQSPFPAGQVMTCTGTGVAMLGQYRSVGKVTANSATGSVDDSDPSHYLGVTATPPPTGEMTICHIPPGNYDARHTITTTSVPGRLTSATARRGRATTLDRASDRRTRRQLKSPVALDSPGVSDDRQLPA